MAAAELRQRPVAKNEKEVPAPNLAAGVTQIEDAKKAENHPSGKAQHGPIFSALRALTFGIYFAGSCIVYDSLSRLSDVEV